MMKRVTSIGILLVLFMIYCFQEELQAQSEGKTKLGFKAGLNFAKWVGDDVNPEVDEDNPNLESKTGLIIGGFAKFAVNEMFTIQPELLYSRKGSTAKEEEGGQQVDVTISVDYLEIPILAKIQIPNSGNVHPNLFIGPAFAIKLNDNFKVKIDGETVVDQGLEDIKSTNIGLVAGGGLDFDMGRSSFTIDGRIAWDLSSLGKDEDIKNRVISVIAGFAF